MNQLPVTVKYIYSEGELKIQKNLDGIKLKEFLKNLKEGDIIEVTYQETEGDHTFAQLAKIHACIDAISSHTGYTKLEVKDMIKSILGLFDEDGKTLKSFKDYNKDELSQAIEVAIKLGESANVSL